MRTYNVTELVPDQIEKIRATLTAKGWDGVMDDIYWLPLPAELLNPEQAEHADECGPHCLAIELGDEWASMELLVRAKGKLRCSCVAYADRAQREWAIERFDALFKDLDIPV